nr:MAG TPA: hypothetical protein [Caudoviricetes sp.]
MFFLYNYRSWFYSRRRLWGRYLSYFILFLFCS